MKEDLGSNISCNHFLTTDVWIYEFQRSQLSGEVETGGGHKMLTKLTIIFSTRA